MRLLLKLWVLFCIAFLALKFTGCDAKKHARGPMPPPPRAASPPAAPPEETAEPV